MVNKFLSLSRWGPVRTPGLNAPLIRFQISALYILFACLCSPTYPFFSLLFLTYLLPYLSFPLKIDPLRFRAGCHKRRLNLALVFLCLFCVVVHFFWLVNACFCCVRFSFFHAKPRELLVVPQTVYCYFWAYLFSFILFSFSVFTLFSCRFRAVD